MSRCAAKHCAAPAVPGGELCGFDQGLVDDGQHVERWPVARPAPKMALSTALVPPPVVRVARPLDAGLPVPEPVEVGLPVVRLDDLTAEQERHGVRLESHSSPDVPGVAQPVVSAPSAEAPSTERCVQDGAGPTRLDALAERKAWALELIEQGYSAARIAARTGVSEAWARRNGAAW